MPSSSPGTVRAHRLTCGYGSKVVLRDLNFELNPGVATAVLGVNGSGKSTLLKTLCGTNAPLDGTIVVDDLDLANGSPRDVAQRVAYVPQEEEPRFGFTVRQVVAMGRLPLSRGLFDSIEDQEAVERAMEQADCLSYANELMHNVSGGERQRALVARGLAQESTLLLLDEPSAHLDLAHQILLGNLLRQLCDAGKTIALALHDLNQAARIADRALVLHNGVIALDGPCESVLTNPALDDIYGVRFERWRDAKGRLWIVPTELSTCP